MNAKQFSVALRSRQRLYGTLIVSTSPRYVEAVSGAGLDFVFIDTEHIPIDRATLSWMCQAYRAAGLPPVVRIPGPDPYQACMVLDGGAACVKVPYIESPEQARQMVGATKLRPLKGQKLRGLLDASGKCSDVLRAYIDKFNENNSLLLNIESAAGLSALDAILAVPGVDGVIVGPHDMTCSLEVPEQYSSPRFDAAVLEVIAKCRAAGVSAGFHAHYADCMQQEIAWARAGANIIIHKGDITLFRETLVKDIAHLRDALGDRQDFGGTGITV